MTAPRLMIRKAMVDIQGKIKPCIQVQADIDPAMSEKILKSFATENLFRRASYSQGFPVGVPTPAASLAPHLTAFIKNDACPEITVKTLLAGQMQQCASIWEVIAFEYIAQRAFDSLCEVMKAASEIGTETTYRPAHLDVAMFAADTAAEMAAALVLTPDAVTITAPDGLADAA
jgi:hypothetical protein